MYMCHIYIHAYCCIGKLLHSCIWYRILSKSCHTSAIRDARFPIKSIQMYTRHIPILE